MMGKAILVIDMPQMCIGCMFNDMQFCQAVHDGGEYIEDADLERKPDWCPLHDVPSKMDDSYYLDDDIAEAFHDGYNTAIDDIFG